jgi:hypothetical protein
MRLNLQDLAVTSFETGSVRYSDLIPTVDNTAPPSANVTVCNRCPPATGSC